VLFTAVACTMSKIVSPMPRKRSATERMVGSEMNVASGVNPLERLTPATTVESKTASTA